jgi:hypothetical protein
MSYRMLGARAAATKLARRFSRRDDIALVDPMTTTAVPEAVVETVVSDVVPVDPLPKTYRATVTRTVTQTAVVEFTAPEGTDSYTMAQGLLESIPAEHWVTQPADSWGYIDHIEEVGPAAAGDVADPLDAPSVLSRRYRRKSDAGAARAFLDTLGDATIVQEAANFGGVSAYIDDLGDIVIVDAAGGERLLTDDEVITLALSCGWQAEGQETDLTTLSRRYRRKAASGQWAAYDEQAIWGVGYDAQSAIADAATNFGPISQEEVDANLARLMTGEMSQALANAVAASGGNVGFEMLASGLLGLVGEEETVELGDEPPVDDETDDLVSKATLSRRYARKMTGSEAIDWIDSAQQQADAAYEAGDLATLQSLLDQSYGLSIDTANPADTWAAEFPSALADLQFQLNDKIRSLGEIETAITEVIDAPTTLARRGRLARRYARKSAFDVTVGGTYIATYEAATEDEALAAYLAEQGFASAEEAAAAAGYSVEEYLADIVVSEVPADEIAADPALAAVA